MSEKSSTATGLRERSKAKRRAAIQKAAMTLFAERGYDHTSIADIAEAAEVAPRTVTLYFANKLDIALSSGQQTAARMNETFAANRDADLIDVLDLWLAREAAEHDPDLIRLAKAMHANNPGLRALSRSRFTAALEAGGDALSQRLQRPTDDPVVILTTAAISALVETHLTVLLPSTTKPDNLRHTTIGLLRRIVDAAVEDRLKQK